ncbi:hypothetical protein BC835DRAFT_1413000 [Cytidiella melzeri]|nr:hypothetical protein BC835DRAFT_1413000 [Cytidiella melzeri]
MAKQWLPLTRRVVFRVVTSFSLIVLGLAAHMIAQTNANFSIYFTFDAFAVATSVITICTLPAMLIIDSLRRGAVTSFIFVELIWLGILWVLWLTSAALSASAISGVDCNVSASLSVPSWFVTGCSEAKVITAFGWLIWFALSGYLVALLVLSITAHNNGSPVWKSSVRDATFQVAPANVDLNGALGTSRETKHQQEQAYPPQTTLPYTPTTYAPTAITTV